MLNLLLCFPGIGGDSAMLRYLSLDAEAEEKEMMI